MEWPEPVERVAAFLRETGAEARIEEFGDGDADRAGGGRRRGLHARPDREVARPRLRRVARSSRSSRATARPTRAKVARLVGARRAAIAEPDEVVAATGFRPGAVSPVPARARLRRPRRADAAPAPHVVWAGAGSDRHMVALRRPSSCASRAGAVEDVVLESR